MLVGSIEEDEAGKIRTAIGEEAFGQGSYKEAQQLFDEVATSEEFVEFLTIPAYESLP